MIPEAEPESNEPGTSPTQDKIATTRPLTNDEIAELVSRRIDLAIRRNAPLEIAIVVILMAVAAVGIGLLVIGYKEHRWELLASGSSCAFAVGWPVSGLLGIRRFNLILQTLPTIIRLSDTKGRKELLFRFVEKLIERL